MRQQKNKKIKGYNIISFLYRTIIDSTKNLLPLTRWVGLEMGKGIRVVKEQTGVFWEGEQGPGQMKIPQLQIPLGVAFPRQGSFPLGQLPLELHDLQTFCLLFQQRLLLHQQVLASLQLLLLPLSQQLQLQPWKEEE